MAEAESKRESESKREAKSKWESDVRTQLSEIDRFKSNQQMRHLCLLASRIRGIAYTQLYGKESVYDVLKELKEKYYHKEALKLLKKMMEFAGFSKERLAPLSSLLSDDSQSDDQQQHDREDISRIDFSYQRLLVFIADNLGDSELLKKVVNALTEKERGIAADQVTTAHALLYHMTNAGTIEDGNYEALKILTEKFTAVGLKALSDKVSVIIQAIRSGDGFDSVDWKEMDTDEKDTGSKSSVESRQALDTKPLVIAESTDQDLMRQNDQQERVQCSSKMICCGLLIIIALAFLGGGAFATTLVYSVRFPDKDQNDSMSLFRNVTYLAFDKGIDTRFHDRVTFDVSSQATSQYSFFQVHVCQVDCTNNNPQTFVRNLRYNKVLESFRNRPHKILARFSPRSDLGDTKLVSEYMLTGSNFTVAVNFSDQDSFNVPSVSLLLFDNVDNCDDFFSPMSSPAASDKAVKNFTFNTMDDFSQFSFSVTVDSYYCGVWDIPQASNFSFEYEITSDILSYNISYYLDQVPSPCKEYEPSDSPFNIVLRNRNVLQNRKVCLLFYQSLNNSLNIFVDGDVIVAKTNNVGFIFSLLGCLVFLVLIIIVCLSLFVCLRCCCCRRS